MKRFLILAMVVLALLAAGCTGSDEATTEDVETPVIEEGEQVAEEVVEEPILIPELEIMSVTATQTGLDITVKNVGNATAESVHCGIMVIGISNKISYDEYMGFDEIRETMIPAVVEGVTGTTFIHVTDYKYKETNNLTIEFKLESSDYLGDLEAGQSMTGETNVYSGNYNTEYWKIAWMEGDEANYVVY